MPIEVSSTVLKQEVADSIQLSAKTYRTAVPEYTLANIKRLYSSAPYIDQNFDPNIFCKEINVPTAQELFSINRTAEDMLSGETIKFDTLSAMYMSAVIPLTDIRKSYFTFIERKDGKYQQRTYSGNASLADSAICGTNDLSFANNTNGESDFLIRTGDDFLTYSGKKQALIDLRNSLVVDEYDARLTSTNLVSAGVVSSLSTLFSEGLNKIRNELCCIFTDSAYYTDKTVTYHRYNDSSTTPENLSALELTMWDYAEISSYEDFDGWTIQPGSGEFIGWTTVLSSNVVQYKPGDELLIDNDYDLYPVIAKNYLIVYHGKNNGGPAFLEQNETSSIVSAYCPEGSSHVVSAIGNYDSNAEPLRYDSLSDQNSYSSSFLGYASTPDGTPFIRAGETIQNIASNYDLYPVYSSKSQSFPLNVWKCWQVNQLEAGESFPIIKGNIFNWGNLATAKSSNMIWGSNDNPILTVSIDVPPKFVKQIRFSFTGYINEQNKTHAPNADKQASNIRGVDKDGYAKIYVSNLMFGGRNLAPLLTKHTLEATSIANWYNTYVVRTFGEPQSGNLKRYYYDRRNSNVFSNMLFQRFNGFPILFDYAFINQDGTQWPWPNPKQNNGTLNCFATVKGGVNLNNCVITTTAWIDYPGPMTGAEDNKTMTIDFGITEKCDGAGVNGKYGGSYGQVFLTKVEVKV